MGSVTENTKYKILALPQSSPIQDHLIEKFRTVKLSALQTSPSEWIYSYSAESHHSLSIWKARLARQNTIFICVALPNEAENLPEHDILLRGEWLAFMAVRGPLKREDWRLEGHPEPALEVQEQETRWHLYDLYTFPEHRGKRIARDLEHHAYDFIISCTREQNKYAARTRLFVNPKNVPLVEAYKRTGFAESGMISLKEGLEANGMVESLPDRKDVGDEEFVKRFETRFGMAMERITEM